MRNAAVLALVVWAASAQAGLLGPGQTLRRIPFTLADGDKPMLAATVGDHSGRVLLDNGTPYAIFINRDSVALGAGTPLAQGRAASGQLIHVQRHDKVAVAIDGQALAVDDTVLSGNFGFTAPAFGADFLGFLGTPALQPDAFALDYPQQQLVLIKPQPDGGLGALAPTATETLAQWAFSLPPGGQPSFAVQLGTLPLVAELDTGDAGTLYASDATVALLRQQGLLRAAGDRWQLRGLRIAGVRMAPTPVGLVQAGGPDDHRNNGQPDLLRLGAAFLRAQPLLWNFAAHQLTLLKPGSAYPKRLRAASAP
ncbi:MAG: hypothetical protein Fur007_04040 [Rhodoferax sp.]